jgi:hypothetical protein
MTEDKKEFDIDTAQAIIEDLASRLEILEHKFFAHEHKGDGRLVYREE